MNKSLILVVEDDTSVRNLITTTLKAHEYRYLTAPDGQSAILEASSHNPDIVLLDLGLPDMDGVEIIKKIRTWSNMPIIVISTVIYITTYPELPQHIKCPILIADGIIKTTLEFGFAITYKHTGILIIRRHPILVKNYLAIIRIFIVISGDTQEWAIIE